MKINIGEGATLDIDKLITSRLLVQGASGSGKSWLLRLIAEQIGGRVPIHLIDPEGEFATLREKLDLIVVGPTGDLPAAVKTAAPLARRLLELGSAAVIDVSELAKPDRRRFVRLYIEALLAAPRKLWRPLLVLLDEAHDYCPERGHGEAESAGAVISLMCQGRKRGFAGVLATQRLSKLAKDAASEAGTILIGRTSPVDQERAADLLGIPRAQRTRFTRLEVGTWLGYGPALPGADVLQFRAGAVQTTHPKAGASRAGAPAAPSEQVKKAVAELAELGAKPDDEPVTLDQAAEQIRRLRAELRASAAKASSAVNSDAIAKAVEAARAEFARQQRAATRGIEQAAKAVAMQLARAQNAIATASEALVGFAAAEPAAAPFKPQPAAPAKKPSGTLVYVTPEGEAISSADGPKIGGGCLRMLMQLVVRHPARWTEAQWATLSELKRTGGTWQTYKSRLMAAGLVERDGEYYSASELALQQYNLHASNLTSGNLKESWKQRLGGGAARMIDALAAQYPEGLTRQELAEAVDIAASGGTFGTYLSRLRSNGLIEEQGDLLRASSLLMES